MRSVVLLVLFVSCAAAPKEGLTVESLPIEAPRRGVKWRGDSEAALAEARKNRKAVLIFFAAEWSELSRRMEREVLEAPRVRGVLNRGVAIKANVDARDQGDLCTVFRLGEAVPAFALFGPDGTVAAQWTGYEKADSFRDRVDRALRAARLPTQLDAPWAEAMEQLADDEVHALRELSARLAREKRTDLAARLMLAECREQFYRFRWSGVVDAADQFLLRFPDHAATREVLYLRGRALYRGTGQRDPAQVARVVELIDEANPEVAAVGELAGDALLEALLTRNRKTGEACARALGRIRDSRMLPDLIAHLDNKRQRYTIRARLCLLMGVWADPVFLESLIDVLGDRYEPAAVRIAAAKAVTRIGASHGGLYGMSVSAPMFAALDNGGTELKIAVLDTLAQVNDAFDLSQLADAMKTRAVSSAACGLFMQRAGVRLVGPEGAAIDDLPSNAPDVLLAWWEANSHRLRWVQDRRRYAP